MREKTLLRGILDYYSTNTYTEKTTHIIKSIRIMHIEMYASMTMVYGRVGVAEVPKKEGNGAYKFD